MREEGRKEGRREARCVCLNARRPAAAWARPAMGEGYGFATRAITEQINAPLTCMYLIPA